MVDTRPVERVISWRSFEVQVETSVVALRAAVGEDTEKKFTYDKGGNSPMT